MEETSGTQRSMCHIERRYRRKLWAILLNGEGERGGAGHPRANESKQEPVYTSGTVFGIPTQGKKGRKIATAVRCMVWWCA